MTTKTVHTLTSAEIDEAERWAIAKVIEVRIGHAQSDGRDIVSEAIGQDDKLLKLIANTLHANAYAGHPMDECEVGRRVLGVVRDYCVEVARFRGVL